MRAPRRDPREAPPPLSSRRLKSQGAESPLAPLCPTLPGGETPQESSPTHCPSSDSKVSAVAQLWLQGAWCRSMQEPRTIRHGPEATHKRPTGRGSSAPWRGGGAGGAALRSVLSPNHRPDSKPKTAPRSGRCQAHTCSSNHHHPLLAAPPSGPSLPGARRGRLRSKAPAPRRVSPGPRALRMQQPQGVLQVAF